MTALTSPITDADRLRADGGRFRPDIQALRALAIVLVVLNHLWPARLPGGYVGVDVFFVISGYLITAHLFKELSATGRIRLGQFYARRIRRLLPAALLVLVCSGILVAVFLPYPQWRRNAAEIAASAGYVENWLLSLMSVNYSAHNDAASVAQHYWSLSVEEQFYLLWPLALIFGVWSCARLVKGASLRRSAFIVLGGIAVLSFAASVLYTAVAPQQAYFATFTRAWEFAVGGLLALLGVRIVPSHVVAAALSAVGLGAIVVSALWFGSATPFPGIAALLPVLGTSAIILAGARGSRAWHSPVSAAATVQWFGGVSYSLYLWHWPLIVIAPFALGSDLTSVSKLGILGVALLLAALTKMWVEDRGRHASVWNRSVRRSLIGMIGGMLVVGLVAGALYVGHAVRQAGESVDAELASGPCAGPAAMRHLDECPDAFGPPESVVMTQSNSPFFSPEQCVNTDELVFGGRQTTRVCDFSEGSAGAPRVWVVGDSHAEHWQGALFDLAAEHRWSITISLFGGCPVADVAFIGFRNPAPADEVADCRAWSRAVSERIVRDHPDFVFTSMASRLQLVDEEYGVHTEQFVTGLLRDWNAWADAGVRVFPIGDVPLNGEVRNPDCLVLNASDPLQCARPRAQAQPADPLLLAAQEIQRPEVRAIDLTSSFCDDTSCYAAIGAEAVYFDADHLNIRYARMLAPDIDRIVSASLTDVAG